MGSHRNFKWALTNALLAFISLCFFWGIWELSHDTGGSKSFSATHFQEFGLFKQQCIFFWWESYKANIASEAPSFWCFFSFARMGKPLVISAILAMVRFFCGLRLTLWRDPVVLARARAQGRHVFSVPCVLNSHWWLLALDSSTDWLLIGNLICCLSSTSDVERNTEQLGWSVICSLQFNHRHRSVADQVFYSATETHVAWFAFL